MSAPRIIVHAGFHKTGTTSLQSFLRANREALAPHARIYLGDRLGALRRQGRIYGERPLPWRRRAFRRGLAEFLASIPDSPVILISRESLSGAMPGALRFGRPITRYAPHSARLARDLVAGCRARFGAGAQVALLYTTRAPETLLPSLWAHQLRTKRLTLDFDTFAAQFGPGFDLKAEAALIARAVAPVPVHVRALEEVADDRLGPGRIACDLLGLSEAERAALVPPPDRHRGASTALQQRFLEMNRNPTSLPRLRAEKERLWKAERE